MLIHYRYQGELLQAIEVADPVMTLNLVKVVDQVVIDGEFWRYGWSEFEPTFDDAHVDCLTINLIAVEI